MEDHILRRVKLPDSLIPRLQAPGALRKIFEETDYCVLGRTSRYGAGQLNCCAEHHAVGVARERPVISSYDVP